MSGLPDFQGILEGIPPRYIGELQRLQSDVPCYLASDQNVGEAYNQRTPCAPSVVLATNALPICRSLRHTYNRSVDSKEIQGVSSAYIASPTKKSNVSLATGLTNDVSW